MRSKFEVALDLTSHGIDMWILNGQVENNFWNLVNGCRVGTYFPHK